jgi:transcriptional regulator with PAS, ATPase and Fis domain
VELIESELFGYDPGAFTGAKKSGHIGKFEHAHNGTIFLDEIGDMPLNMQAKLLRVLQEKEITKIGSNIAINVDFRLISATNRNLPEMLGNCTFRSDLFYRINVLTLKVPPLRRIKADIPLMVESFLAKMSELVEKEVKSISDEAMEILQIYHWPGNVRELRNVIERSFVVCKGSQIRAKDLPQNIVHARNRLTLTAKKIQSLRETLEEAEKKAILEALRLTKNEKKSAAELLGIHRTGLYQKIKKYGISLSSLFL